MHPPSDFCESMDQCDSTAVTGSPFHSVRGAAHRRRCQGAAWQAPEWRRVRKPLQTEADEYLAVAELRTQCGVHNDMDARRIFSRGGQIRGLGTRDGAPVGARVRSLQKPTTGCENNA